MLAHRVEGPLKPVQQRSVSGHVSAACGQLDDDPGLAGDAQLRLRDVLVGCGQLVSQISGF